MTKQGFRKLCRELRAQGRSLGEIVSITKRPKTTVFFHIRDVLLLPALKAAIKRRSAEHLRTFNKQRKGKSALGRHPTPFRRWTRNAVILVSHLMFDGELGYSSCVYTNRSHGLIRKVRRLMRTVYTYFPRQIESTPGVHRISYHNVELAAYLRKKSGELLQTIPRLPRELKRSFLQAFFDDEGSVYFIGKKRRVRGYQYRAKILELIQRLLREFGIGSKVDYAYHEIVIGGRENLKIFAREVNFSPDVRVNGDRSNSIWKRSLEKRHILRMALTSYQKPTAGQ